MTKSSISKFEAGDLVSITCLTEDEGGAIPRLITKVNSKTSGMGWMSYNLTPWHLNNRHENERNLKLAIAKNPSHVKDL